MQWNQGTLPLIGNVAAQLTNKRLGARRIPSFRMQIGSNHCGNARVSRFGAALCVIHKLKIMILRLPLRTLWKCRAFEDYDGKSDWAIIIPVLFKQQQKQLQACCGYIYEFVYLVKCCLAGMKMAQQFAQVLLQMLYRVKITLIMISSLLFSCRVFVDKVSKGKSYGERYIVHLIAFNFNHFFLQFRRKLTNHIRVLWHLCTRICITCASSERG